MEIPTQIELIEVSERANVRRNAGVTATWLAAYIGVSQTTLYAWESGTHEPNGLQRAAYANALAELVSRTDVGA